MPLERVPFGGLTSKEDDAIIPFGQAVEALDVYLDNNTLAPRNGYRAATSSAIGAGTGRFIGRYRHGVAAGDATTLVAADGALYRFADPASETTEQSTVTTVGTYWQTGDLISGCQLNGRYYLGSDNSDQNTYPWRRVNSSYAVESLLGLAKVDVSSVTKSKTSPSWWAYRANDPAGNTISVSGCAKSTTVSNLLSDWYAVVGTGGDSSNPSDGATFKVTLVTAVDISGAKYLAVAVSPPDSGKGGKHVTIEISEDDSTYYHIGTTYDTAGQAGSPNIIICPLDNVPDANRNAFKYIRFTVKNVNDAVTLRYAVYGHMVLYGRASTQPQKYYLTLYDSTTEQESPLSAVMEVTVSDTDVNGPPQYTNQYITSDAYANTSTRLGPIDISNVRIFNRFASPALKVPTISEIGALVTISGTLGTFSGTLTLRFWKEATNGIRLVESTSVTSGAAFTFYDRGADSILSNILYRPGGTPPRCNAMASYAGRIIAGGNPAEPNRLYISSFTAPDAAGSKIPQFPLIALEDSDGWAFDLSPAYDDQIQVIVAKEADGVYISTHMNTYFMYRLEPNSKPRHIIGKGAMGRRAAFYAGDRYVFAAADGVYSVWKGSVADELTRDIWRLYREWLNPGTSTVVAYQSGRLYVISGTKGLRFYRGEWTQIRPTDTFQHCAGWRDPTGTIEHLWFLDSDRDVQRWQPDYAVGSSNKATTDDGTALPAWVYSTGFAFTHTPARVRSAYLESTSPVEVQVLSTDDENEAGPRVVFPRGDDRKPFAADYVKKRHRLRITGLERGTVKQAWWERVLVEKE